MATDVSVAWQGVAGTILAIRYWGGDYVVYNPLSGNTHILDIATGELLKAIVNERMTTHDVCRCLAQFLEVPDGADVADSVGRILNHLDELGLIEPVGGC